MKVVIWYDGEMVWQTELGSVPAIGSWVESPSYFRYLVSEVRHLSNSSTIKIISKERAL